MCCNSSSNTMATSSIEHVLKELSENYKSKKIHHHHVMSKLQELYDDEKSPSYISELNKFCINDMTGKKVWPYIIIDNVSNDARISAVSYYMQSKNVEALREIVRDASFNLAWYWDTSRTCIPTNNVLFELKGFPARTDVFCNDRTYHVSECTLVVATKNKKITYTLADMKIVLFELLFCMQ